MITKNIADLFLNDDLERLANILRDALRCDGVIGPSDRDDVRWFCNKVLGKPRKKVKK